MSRHVRAVRMGHERPNDAPDTLDAYRGRRDFDRTPEPAGDRRRSEGTGGVFVVQKHAATRLHYDFRLELGGVLKSWAVPKGPSLDPSDKRLAVHVEDHPLEYGDFEGVIPEGEYGGGTVMLWDRGRWIPKSGSDPEAAYRDGRLDFTLHGRKLGGDWTLVRMRGSAGEEGKNWLLIKRSDAAARRDGTVADDDRSVATGRTMEGIRRQGDRVWTEEGEQDPAGDPRTGPGAGFAEVPDPDALTGRRRQRFPGVKGVQLATLTDRAPEGEDWIHEIKYDGYRILARIEGAEVRLLSRNGKDWTTRFPEIADALRSLPIDTAVLDGEVVALAADGTSSFQRLQEVVGAGRAGSLTYCVFDLLYLDGYDLSGVPLLDRKGALAKLLLAAGMGRAADRIGYSDHVRGNGPGFFDRACRLGLEGIVSKRADSRYRDGRTTDWLKVKCRNQEEFVVGGFTEPSGARTGFGSLLLGAHTPDGRLVYTGKVGTGFTDRQLREIHERLRPLEIDESPFDPPPTAVRRRDVHWVRPEIVVDIEFTEWTRDGSLRHPSFRGIREDRAASEIRLPTTGAAADSSAGADPSAAGAAGPNGAAMAGAAAVVTPDAEAEVAGVRLTHPDRILYPEQGVTKLELARFYEEIRDWILPHLIDRPLAVVRCPRGHGDPCFYQKHPGEGLPETVRRVVIEEKDGPAENLYVDSLEGLITLVQFGVLELHTWGCRIDDVERPDRMVFDLDPGPGVPWPRVVDAARELHDRLSEPGLRSWVKTTGGKGLHVVVPLDRRHDWDDVKAFARSVAEEMAGDDPDAFTATMSKAKRRGRIYVDYLRNGRGATFIAPYSTRARSGAPISVPVRWDELGPALLPDRYDIGNLRRRLSVLDDDPWAGLEETRQSITRKD